MIGCDLSILVPALNEAGNLGPLVDQVHRAFCHDPHPPQIVLVDDGSTDATAAEIDQLAARHPRVVALHHASVQGQSAALRTALLASVAPLVATLDADLQNDPVDLPRMRDLLLSHGVDLVQGDRSAQRRDHPGRRLASAVGRWTRRVLLRDPTRDTGCASRVLRRELALRLPLHRPGMHRFIPACSARLGAAILETPVAHHPRRRGRSKYGTAPLRRGLPALCDCFRVQRFPDRPRRSVRRTGPGLGPDFVPTQRPVASPAEVAPW